jgi:CBS domain-containing protein
MMLWRKFRGAIDLTAISNQVLAVAAGLTRTARRPQFQGRRSCSMKVSELMVSEVITCKDTDKLGEAARLMWERDIGFIPVVSSESGALVGVITDRDGFIAAYFQGKPLWEIPVTSAMSARIATCPPEAGIEDAERLMREFQVHRLPVTGKDGKVVGVISINDFARQAATDADEELEEKVAVTLGAICEPRSAEAPPQAS